VEQGGKGPVPQQRDKNLANRCGQKARGLGTATHEARGKDLNDESEKNIGSLSEKKNKKKRKVRGKLTKMLKKTGRKINRGTGPGQKTWENGGTGQKKREWVDVITAQERLKVDLRGTAAASRGGRTEEGVAGGCSARKTCGGRQKRGAQNRVGGTNLRQK